jgi:hypothetical protein
MENQEQHYVPQCYLKSFKNTTGKLYTLDFDVFKYQKIPYPREIATSAVCKKENFYMVNFELPSALNVVKQFGPQVIEEKIFGQYENAFPIFINKIELKDEFNFDEADLFVRTLLDIKLRNIYWRKNFFEKNKLEFIEETFKELENRIENAGKILTSDERASIEEFKSQQRTDPKFASKSHNTSIINRKLNSSKVEQKIITNLLFNPWTVFYDAQGRFLTSDNPGYCIDKNDVVQNTKFEDGFCFTMPLTPYHCLLISDASALDLSLCNNQNKRLNYKIAPEELIYSFNKAGLFYVNKYVFGNNADVLAKFLDDLKHDKFLSSVNAVRFAT